MKEAKPDYAQGEAAVAARAIADSGGWEPFVDWSSTCPGNRGVNREGRYELYDAPIGIAITIEEADKSTPLVVAETPWEHGGSLVPLRAWEADAQYHLLYVAFPHREADKTPGLSNERYL